LSQVLTVLVQRLQGHVHTLWMESSPLYVYEGFVRAKKNSWVINMMSLM